MKQTPVLLPFQEARGPFPEGLKNPKANGVLPSRQAASGMDRPPPTFALFHVVVILQAAAHGDVQRHVVAAAAVGALHLLGVAQRQLM